MINKCEQRFECKNKNHCIINDDRYRIPILGMKSTLFYYDFYHTLFYYLRAEGKTGLYIY